jgi:hypothetical protein
VGKRPVPFRTRKLSPPAPMVLHSPECGRVGHRRTYLPDRASALQGPYRRLCLCAVQPFGEFDMIGRCHDLSQVVPKRRRAVIPPQSARTGTASSPGSRRSSAASGRTAGTVPSGESPRSRGSARHSSRGCQTPYCQRIPCVTAWLGGGVHAGLADATPSARARLRSPTSAFPRNDPLGDG